MDEAPSRPADTQEFIAMWNAVTAEHLTHKLTGALQQLADRIPNAPVLRASEAEALSPLLIHALQVAASRDGGVHAAVQFLAEYGAAPTP